MTEKIIHLLDNDTIDRIAAGEVVERPSSVVKELVENSIDAGSTAITVELKDGGTELIRVTDNGHGIPKEQIELAFLSHATSKIYSAEDILDVETLGFRGEALASIAAVAKVELITKTDDEPVGSRYVIESGVPQLTDIGAPSGTSVFVRKIFYNTPARLKFLKSPTTEGNYVTDLIEKLALSHPDISFRYIINGKDKLTTPGNGVLSDTIYAVYGRQYAKNLLEIDAVKDNMHLYGYIGTPAMNHGNRGFESFFVNGRFVKSKLLYGAAESGYKGYLMHHQYPFLVLLLDITDGGVDVNVHPQKLEIRFSDDQAVSEFIERVIYEKLSFREDIQEVPVAKPSSEEKALDEAPIIAEPAEPFEAHRLESIKKQVAAQIRADSPYSPQYENKHVSEEISPNVGEGPKQLTFLSEEAKPKHKIIGQLFATYWLVEFEDDFYMIDQHAAHEKVLYERTMARIRAGSVDKQYLNPPQIVSLSVYEQDALKKYAKLIEDMGYTVSEFGGREYAISTIPASGFNVDVIDMFKATIGVCAEAKPNDSDDMITERVAEMSCKAAIKGNDRISYAEACALIDELMTLDNPYHCPHGRPTIIKMSKYEIEKKFKRIV